ncbi:FtsP/CotA-like multicopper oxidase with cupredoxin domain [Saccharothrix carnea]|uniref:FtsP/CotA-like multicopper oxidase with cupredoxin domain n=1 Tax=Saccharothrix carnea TaxID=1280637 RepID=A0A2P8I2L9_SACCR|nr:multicopper oxidase family protein [Saccharothrix carnea]PSL52696.1 FtsP/CotA-like multicopper oxidase with cupredoxin domain [Saccharothrix carnea]
MATRRDVLKLAVVGGIVAAVPVEAAVAELTSTADPASATPFAAEMPVPTVLRPTSRTRDTDFYDIRMFDTTAEVIPGLVTGVRTYNGSFPGPTIRAARGRQVVVRHHNGLAVDTSVHLHGGHVPAGHDGHPMDLLKPGATREYHYPNAQAAASLWYHDHAHGLEAENVYRGLHASYVVTDEHERGLKLPSGKYEVELQLRDARIEQDGTLTFTRAQSRPHLLVNGRERPHFRVAARKYRFRVYNVSVDRFMSLRLADGGEFVQIGSDGGFLAAPVGLTELRLSAGERADVVVDFSRYKPGTSVVLQNTSALATENPDVLRFDVGFPAYDDSRVPPVLLAAAALPPATVERRFVLEWNAAQARYTINGQVYDPARVDVQAKLGTTEIWTVVNADAPAPAPNFHLNHNFHTHQTQFRVLDRNGVPVRPAEAGQKDVVMVAPGDTVRLALTWKNFTGRYVVHCHQLPHSDYSQMLEIEITA